MLCRFCKEEIIDGALKCKHCGSMLETQGAAPVSAAEHSGGVAKYTDYSQVPWFRKHWFVALSFLVFMPVGIIIMLSGDVYYLRKGQLRSYGKWAKITAVLMGTIYFLIVLARLRGIK